MPMPKIIRVFGIPYTLEKQDRITVGGQNADGAVTYNTATIEIVDGMPIEVERVVVMHEVMHAIFKGQGQNDFRANEDLIEAVAHGIMQVLRDNSELVAYIVGKQETVSGQRVARGREECGMDNERKRMTFIYDPAWQETDITYRDLEIARREILKRHNELIEAGFKLRTKTNRPDVCRHYWRSDWASIEIRLEDGFTFDELALSELDIGE